MLRFSPLVLLLSAIGLAEDFPRYPILEPGVQAHYLSSYDRTGGNDDGFAGTYSALYVDENGENVIFDVKGPGTLYNLWFTSRINGRSPLETGRIRFYFDEEERPRLDMDVDELFSGRHPPFVPPFVYHAFQSTGGYVSYMPFPFQKRLKITTEERVGFYNAYYHTYSADRVVESWSPTASPLPADEPAPRGRMESGTISLPAPAMPDGEPVPSTTTLLEREGRGAITSIVLDPLFPLTPYQLNHILLRITWDAQEEAGVDAPLGHFFGSGLGEASVRALPLGMSPSGPYYCRLPMPFWESFRIELVNENPKETPEIYWEVRIDDEGYDEGASGYFHARYAREWPTTMGKDYTILETSGRGVYLGQMMTVEPLRPEIKRWWEGDLRIYLDGRRHPAFHGTGHEDEYLGGWSNEWLMNPYSLPMHGEPKTADLRQVDFQWSAATTVYRFFSGGGVPFWNGISISTEHGARNTADAMYSSVAYYYGRPEGLTKLDELDVEGPIELTSQFEGRDDGVDWTESGRIVEAVSRFSLVAPAGAGRLRLRRLFDQSEVQEAEVWVNGARAGTWYTAATNPDRRWREEDFLLPDVPSDGGRLEFEIRPARSGWNEFRYELWGSKW